MHLSIRRSLLGILILSVGAPFISTAQSTYIDEMVRDNINLRRKEDIYKSQRSKASKTKTSTKIAGKATLRPAEIDFAVDMYNPLPEQDAKGLTVVLTFTGSGQNAKTITQSRVLSGNNSLIIKAIPAGSYTVSASSKGKKILLATKCGEPTNPQGGNFSASQQISIAAGKDDYGNKILKSSPSLIWMRVQ